MRDEVKKSLSHSQVHNYWREPPDMNRAKRYIGRPGYHTLIRLLDKHARKTDKLLELGCSVGTTLNEVYGAGYNHLTGVEINPESVALMRQLYPDTAAHIEIHNGPIEDVLPELGRFDVVYSKAVQCHLHPKAARVFQMVAERCRMIITLEDEHTFSSGRHWPRNYRKVYAPFGFRQVEYLHRVEGMGEAYVGRVLVR